MQARRKILNGSADNPENRCYPTAGHHLLGHHAGRAAVEGGGGATYNQQLSIRACKYTVSIDAESCTTCAWCT